MYIARTGNNKFIITAILPVMTDLDFEEIGEITIIEGLSHMHLLGEQADLFLFSALRKTKAVYEMLEAEDAKEKEDI